LIAIIEDYLFIHTVITHIYSDFYTTGNTEEPATYQATTQVKV